MCQFLQVRKCNCAFCIPNVFFFFYVCLRPFPLPPGVYDTRAAVVVALTPTRTHTYYKQPAALAPMVPHPLYTHYHFCTRIHIKCNAFMFSEVFAHVYILVPIHSLTHSFTHSFVRPFIHTKRSHFVRSHSNVQTFSFLHLLILLLRLFLVKRKKRGV